MLLSVHCLLWPSLLEARDAPQSTNAASFSFEGEACYILCNAKDGHGMQNHTTWGIPHQLLSGILVTYTTYSAHTHTTVHNRPAMSILPLEWGCWMLDDGVTPSRSLQLPQSGKAGTTVDAVLMPSISHSLPFDLGNKAKMASDRGFVWCKEMRASGLRKAIWCNDPTHPVCYLRPKH